MAHKNTSDWHILVVEDEFDSAQVVSKILRHSGAQVSIARDGKSCLHILESLRPTLIIMDLALPELDGWQTLKRLRANESTRAIPVVAITAYHSASVAEDAQRAGFDAYFAKPIDTNTLIKSLASVLA